MSRIVAAINMTLDGFCDHTSGIADDELHQHYADLLRDADAVLYGRITYQLMEFWRTLVDRPSGEKMMDDFARVIDQIPKIVFSHTLNQVDWETAERAKQDLQTEVLQLRQQPGRDILVGSRSIIIQLMQLNLIDEYQFCVHPIVAGSGLPLFEHIKDKNVLKLTRTKTFHSGVIQLCYEPSSKEQHQQDRGSTCLGSPYR